MTRPHRRFRLHSENDGIHVAPNHDGVAACTSNAVVAGQQEARLPRGYHIEVWAAPTCRKRAHGGSIAIHPAAATASSSSRTIAVLRRLCRILGRGEMIPNDGSYCEIDPNVVDKWASRSSASIGNSRPRIPAGEAHAGDVPRLIAEMGGEVYSPCRPKKTVTASRRRRHHPRAGWRAHGRRSQDLGRELELPDHEVKNLFVADGAPLRRRPTRIPPGRSWRCRGGRPNTSRRS